MIFLNKQPLKIDIVQFPILINGIDKSGASFFSVELISEFFRAGSKILFFSGYEMAKESFIKNVGHQNVIKTHSYTENIQSHQAIILEDKNEKLLVEYLNKLPDIAERILYIKNFDLYSPETVKCLMLFKKLVCMGDMDKASHAWGAIEFNTTIYFSYPNSLNTNSLPHLEKYNGFLKSNNENGIVIAK